MKKLLQIVCLSLSLALSTTTFAQTVQSNFINYQGVASDTDGEVMADQSITVGIALKYATTDAAEYAENHSVTTDANGVFSLKIGNGTATISIFDNFQWGGGIATFVTISINGAEIGTTELLAVPYAITSGDWHREEVDNIINANSGTVKVTGNLEVGANIQLQLGPAANEISIDATLAGNSDKAIPTEKAVKAYIDANGASGLEALDQGNGIGWRLKVDNPDRYGDIGFKAVDLSSTGLFNQGATGNYSTAMGFNTKASGNYSTAMGGNVIASGSRSVAIGFAISAPSY